MIRCLSKIRPSYVKLAVRLSGSVAKASSSEDKLKDLPFARRDEIEYMSPPVNVNKSATSMDPIIKDIMLGTIPLEIFKFPELNTKDEVAELDAMYDQVKKFFLQIDSAAIDKNCNIPDEVYKGLGELGLFGQQIPQQFGGLELNNTQVARLWEATTLDPSIAVTLAAHQSIGLKGILMVGTPAQKEKYLPKLATGEHIAAFCLTEPSSGSDAQSLKTRAELDPSGRHYVLNGGKCWISNGVRADIMTVFARTKIPDTGEDKITAFIVDRAFGGVVSMKSEDKLGIRGSNTCEVMFQNCPVPVENVLGEVGHGFKLALRILNSGRFSMGSAGAGILRYLLSFATEHALARHQFGQPIAQFGAIRQKLADVACDIYAMESMSYLIAGLLDANPQRDLSLEAAAIKIYSSEAVWRGVSEMLQVFGGMGFVKSLPVERYLRDARIMLIFEGTNEILRLLIAGASLSAAGRELQAFLKLFKSPGRHSLKLIRLILRKSNQISLNAPSVGYLNRPCYNSKEMRFEVEDMQPLKNHLHPQLEGVANNLSKYLLKLDSLTKDVLRKHGANVVNQQMEMLRCADGAIDIFMVACCLSRCSRSLAIGIPRAEHEVLLVRSIAKKAFDRMDVIFKTDIEHMDRMEDIADTIVQERGYSPLHPLSRVW